MIVFEVDVRKVVVVNQAGVQFLSGLDSQLVSAQVEVAERTARVGLDGAENESTCAITEVVVTQVQLSEVRLVSEC